jgi:SHS2 domain-containing protein
MTEAGYAMVDHPADLRFRVWAGDRESLFRQAARALLETMFPITGVAAGNRTLEARIDVSLEGVDRDDLLVRWLGELHFQADTRQLVPQAIVFQQLDETRLRAECIMTRAGKPGCEIKAVTYHQSGIREQDGRLEATLLFDV